MRMQHNVIIQIYPSRDIRTLTENNSSITSGNISYNMHIHVHCTCSWGIAFLAKNCNSNMTINYG